jgi:hypothetical protein
MFQGHGHRHEQQQQVSKSRPTLELRASGALGLRWQAVFGPQIVWNKSTRYQQLFWINTAD